MLFNHILTIFILPSLLQEFQLTQDLRYCERLLHTLQVSGNADLFFVRKTSKEEIEKGQKRVQRKYTTYTRFCFAIKTNLDQ